MAFLRAARKDEIPAGSIREFQVNGTTLAIANVSGSFYAIDNTCLHRGGPLGQGEVEDSVVTCPWHGWQYDVTTGTNLDDDTVCVVRYEVKLEGGSVLVAV